MIPLLIIALGRSLLIWTGMWILLSRKYKWSIFILYVMLTTIFLHLTTLLFGQWASETLFIFTFAISNLRKNGWVAEAKTNFFYLSIVRMVMILARAWAEFASYQIYGTYALENFYELPFALFLNVIICIIAFLFVRNALKKTGITVFATRIDVEFQTLLAVGAGIILLCYYGVNLLPMILDIPCSGMVYMQPIYMTMLSIITGGLILLFSAIIKKEMLLNKHNASLANVTAEFANINASLANVTAEFANINAQLSYKQEELREKEALIESLDQKIMNSGNVNRKLRDFEHGQQELLWALGGSIESDDKEMVYELLAEYGVKVQEVLNHEPSFPDASHLTSSKLMPVRNLLYVKANEAMKEAIDFTLEIPTKIEDIGMPILDFVDIIGIWLTNAIEEARHTEDKWVHTSLILGQDPDGLTLLEARVTNSCRETALSPTVAYKQGATTKGEGRGSGLRIVEEMMLKHEHIHVSTKVSNRKYMQLLEIVLDKLTEVYTFEEETFQ